VSRIAAAAAVPTTSAAHGGDGLLKLEVVGAGGPAISSVATRKLVGRRDLGRVVVAEQGQQLAPVALGVRHRVGGDDPLLHLASLAPPGAALASAAAILTHPEGRSAGGLPILAPGRRTPGDEQMEHTHLGRTGLLVSRLCLGTMNFGPETTEEDSFAIMDRALDEGVNFFDTANVYGWKKGEGVTEQILGRWFAKGGGRRDKVVLATKVFGSMGDWPNENKLSALNIRRACEGSLRRMQTDHIDLYQMHHVDRDTPWDEIWQAMDLLVQQGKVLYVGSSNFAGWHIAKANEAARARHTLGLVSEQSLYNLAERSIELEVLPACRDYGLGVIPWSPLLGGLLGGALRKAQEGRAASENQRKRLERYRPQVEEYEAFCGELGERPSDVALAWLLHQDGVTGPIVGPRTMEQLEQSLRALEIELDEKALSRLDEIWPGPGGPAPEAYAW
jgi:aryl-alcohol dehydrogenase-like predicted oxidoreductase